MSPWPPLWTLGLAALEGGLLILVVWAVCRVWPGMPAAARSGLLWLACARLLVGLLPLAPVGLPILPDALRASVPGVERGEADRPVPPASRAASGARQQALGREMERLSRQVTRQVRSLLEEAVRSGAARPLR